MALTNIPKVTLYGEVVEYWEEEEYLQYQKNMMSPLEKAKNEISELKEKNILLENALLEMAEIQSNEYDNRIILEDAIIELANLIGGE